MAAKVKSRDVHGGEYEVAVTELAWRPAAYAILVRNDRILLVKQNGAYHLPGGGVDLGEAPEDGVIREVKEEAGLKAWNPRLAGSLSTFFTHRKDHTSETLVHVQSLLLYYRCEVEDGEVSVDGQEEDERSHGLTPEWVALKDLDGIAVGSTVDWRPIVKSAIRS